MLKVIPLISFALGWTLLTHSCNSTPSQSSETLPQIVATPSGQDSQQQQKLTGKTIWKGFSGGVEIEWTADDLFSKSAEKVERIFKPLAKRGYDEFLADVSAGDKTKEVGTKNCDYRRDFEVLSIVGTLISFKDNEYSDCGGAHPTTEMRFTTIDLARPSEVFYGQGENAMDADLRRPGKVVKLTDYFAASDVLNALLADRVIKRALAGAGISSPPRTLASLPEIFAKDGYVLNETELTLRPDFLTRFAFHHIEGDTVAVRLNLPSIAFAYRSQQIGLLLPIPSQLREPLALAVIGQEGFMMQKAPPAIRDQVTRFAFKIGGGARHANVRIN